MIDLEKDTPVEYSKQSRDYQVFRYTYNTIFNQVKMYVDLIKNIWTDQIDDKLLNLRSYTLNFIPRYGWDNSDLRGVTNNFRYLLRSKGTKEAIKSCLEILARVKGISLVGTDVEVIGPGKIRLIVNEEIADVGNVEDLLRYILPAGCVYELVKYTRQDTSIEEQIIVDSLFDNSKTYQTIDLYIPEDQDSYNIPFSNNSLARYETGMPISSEGEWMNSNYIIEIYGNLVDTYYDGQEHTTSTTEYPRGFRAVCNRAGFDPSKISCSKPTILSNTTVITNLRSDWTASDFSYEGQPGAVFIIKQQARLYIRKKSMAITITGKTGHKEYNKQEQTFGGWEASSSDTLFDVNNVSYNGEPAKGINCGSYFPDPAWSTSDFRYSDLNIDASYTLKDIIQLIIDLCVIRLELTGNTSEETYTGYPIEVNGYTWSSDKSFFDESDFTVRNSKAIGVDVGTYFMGLAATITNPNFELSSEGIIINDGYLIIKPADIEFFIEGDSEVIVYDGLEHSTSEYTYTYNGSLDPDIVKNNFNYSGATTVSGKNVGRYDLGLTSEGFSTTPNINAVFNILADSYLVILPKDITITADDQTIIYGDSESLTWSVSGLVDSEDVNKLTINISRDSESIIDIGSYPIIVSGNSEQDNYSLSYVNGTLTIDPYPMTIIINDSEKTYGEIDPLFTYNQIGSTPTIPGPGPTLILSRAPGEDVGTYQIFSDVFDSETVGNYYISSITDGTLTINPAKATIIANDITISEGDPEPLYTATEIGIIGTDTLVYTISCPTYQDSEGTYEIVVNGDSEQGNYLVSYVNGTLTIE